MKTKKIKQRKILKKFLIGLSIGCINVLYLPNALAADLYGGQSIDEDVYNKVVVVNNGDTYDYVCGGYSNNGNVYGNTVNVSGGTISRSIYGGYSDSGNVYGNTVNVSGGTISSGIFGGSAAGNAYGNTVNVSGGTIAGIILGGFSNNRDVYGNIVNISGGTIVGIISGGCSDNGNVYGNTVIIDNTKGYMLDLSSANIYGGCSNDLFGGYTTLGIGYDNTLDVYGKEFNIANIYNFSTINFYMPASTSNNTTILNIANTANISNSVINPYISGNSTLKTNDTLTLISASNLISTNITKNNIVEGVSLIYPTAYTIDATTLKATITGTPTISSQTKSLVETSAASAAFIDSGIDMTSDKGIANAVDASAGMSGFAPFMAIGGSSMRYNTGSHVDSTGKNINIGMAKTINNKNGQLTYGPLFEAGWGSYDSYLDSGIHAKGDISYTGAGAFIRQSNKDGRYYEGSLHYGHMDTDYNSSDLKGSVTNEHYKMNTPYYGMHVGAGKIINIDKKHDIDIYGKYYYSRQAGTEADLASGETYKFAAVNSSRLRAGARYIYNCGEGKKAYVGAAYEYELDGEARATYKGYSAPSPSLKGGSGMVEAGYQVKPAKNSPLTIDMAVNGWTGKQQGVGTTVSFNWSF